jgi:hypothetical protein
VRIVARDVRFQNSSADSGSINISPGGTGGPRPGDVTGDGVVNIDDLFAVIGAWGQCPPPPPACPADVAPPGPPQGNGWVNIDDLFFVLNNWG